VLTHTSKHTTSIPKTYEGRETGETERRAGKGGEGFIPACLTLHVVEGVSEHLEYADVQGVTEGFVEQAGPRVGLTAQTHRNPHLYSTL